jgi:hypothetical protein
MIATFLACPSAGGPDKDASVLRARRRREARYRRPPAHAVDGVGGLPALQGVSRRQRNFLRSSLDGRDLKIVMPSRISISPMRRASVRSWRSATGASSNGVTTRSAASALTGVGAGARARLERLRAQSRCARGALYPCERQTPPQCAGLSSPTASTIPLLLDPPSRDRAKPRAPAALLSAPHVPSPEISSHIQPPMNQCEDGIKARIRWPEKPCLAHLGGILRAFYRPINRPKFPPSQWIRSGRWPLVVATKP